MDPVFSHHAVNGEVFFVVETEALEYEVHQSQIGVKSPNFGPTTFITDANSYGHAVQLCYDQANLVEHETWAR